MFDFSTGFTAIIPKLGRAFYNKLFTLYTGGICHFFLILFLAHPQVSLPVDQNLKMLDHPGNFTVFTCFGKLPAELRLKVWKFAVQAHAEPQTLVASWDDDTYHKFSAYHECAVSFATTKPLPRTLHATPESRAVALKGCHQATLPFLFVCQLRDAGVEEESYYASYMWCIESSPRALPFDFSCDTLELSCNILCAFAEAGLEEFLRWDTSNYTQHFVTNIQRLTLVGKQWELGDITIRWFIARAFPLLRVLTLRLKASEVNNWQGPALKWTTKRMEEYLWDLVEARARASDGGDKKALRVVYEEELADAIVGGWDGEELKTSRIPRDKLM